MTLSAEYESVRKKVGLLSKDNGQRRVWFNLLEGKKNKQTKNPNPFMPAVSMREKIDIKVHPVFRFFFLNTQCKFQDS